MEAAVALRELVVRKKGKNDSTRSVLSPCIRRVLLFAFACCDPDPVLCVAVACCAVRGHG
jgi:hypothetical protein